MALSKTMSLVTSIGSRPETALEDNDFLSLLGDIMGVKTSKNQPYKSQYHKVKNVKNLLELTEVEDSFFNRHGTEILVSFRPIISLKDSNSIRANANRSKIEEQCPISDIDYTTETRRTCVCNDENTYENEDLCTVRNNSDVGSYCGQFSPVWMHPTSVPRTVLVQNIANKVEQKTTFKMPVWSSINGVLTIIGHRVFTIRRGNGIKNRYNLELQTSYTVSKLMYNRGIRHSFCDNKMCWGVCAKGRCFPKWGFNMVNGGWAAFQTNEDNLNYLSENDLPYADLPMIGGEN